MNTYWLQQQVVQEHISLTNPHLSPSEAVTSTGAARGQGQAPRVDQTCSVWHMLLSGEGEGPEPCPTRLELTSPRFPLPEPGGQVSDVHIFTPHARLSADHPILLLRAACQRTQHSGDGVL